ncbi:MAG: adenylate/guanylate cyclase domain-containing protein [bacterium]|nr:adenylate/guanylate cyclase domain-containing protein [bacterium]
MINTIEYHSARACAKIRRGLLLGAVGLLCWNAPLSAQSEMASGESMPLGSASGARWEIMPPTFSDPAGDRDASRPALREIPLPADLYLEGVRTNESPDRSVWYRLRLKLSGAPRELMALRLGQISDRDRTYLNGVLIGETGTWNSPKPQAYDRVRVYEVPPNLLVAGENVLHIQVQPYFEKEYGVYRGRIELGPASAVWRDFYLENTYQAFALVAYLTFGLYFLLFYFRRRNDRENLWFALFLLALVVYSFLGTQFKYILGYELYALKRVQTIALFKTIPLFYLFLRSYYSLPAKIEKFWDRAALAVHLIPLIGVGIVLASESTEVWQRTVNSLVQPGWLIYILAILFILVREAVLRNRDAWIMLASTGILLIALILDILSGRAILNLPPLLTYGFVLFVVSMALVLANRFVRLHDETEDLNIRLEEFNAASRKFVPFELLDMLDRGSIVDVALGDQVQKEMTVLFSDIRSFTELSEQMTPKENFAFINSYLRRMGPVIREHNGFIDKYIGDAIMALFAESTADAFQAALQMQSSLNDWNERRAKHDMQAIEIGVGINHGRLMLGTIGENQRMEGTVISDAVNLAARIEGLTRIYGAAVLTGDATVDALNTAGTNKYSADYHFRHLDRVRVKGKREVIDLFEMVDALPKERQELRHKTADRFAAGLALYLEGRFAEARPIFREIFRLDPTDRAARLYVQRCRKLELAGDQVVWDGTTVLKNK